jgi:hypothetical protein
MQRLGKKQEFDVGVPTSSRSPITDCGTEKFQSDFYLGIYFYLHGNIGICFSICLALQASITDIAYNDRLTDNRSLSTGFTNGGFGGLLWVFIGTILCNSSIFASLAEITSMAPTRSANLFVVGSLKTLSRHRGGIAPYSYSYSFNKIGSNLLTSLW